jgi:hypothetical protein
MWRLPVRCAFFLSAAILLHGIEAHAQQTGTIAGVVRDAQAAVLPGVSIQLTGPALIGGPRSTTSTESGLYQFASLPPGLYDLSFELSGFTTLKRAQVQVQVATTTRLDVTLTVGGLEESIVVSGESPVVDVSSTTTQTNIDKEIYEAIPTGRNPWVMAGLVPGVVTGRLDVGGTEGMQQYNLEAFGSADSQKSFSIDGLKTNWPGGSGGATMQYYGFEMYEEYNMQTASGTAESDVAGVYMNMVTKSGGNRFASDHNLYFMNDTLQGDNVDDRLLARLGLAPGSETGAAGNPIDISYDWSSTLGGPVKRDKAWFFGAIRRWRLDQFQIGARNPDGSQALDDNRIENYMGKLTWQAASPTKISVMFNRNLKYRFHRRDSPYLFVEDKAATLQDQPAQNYVVQANQVVGQRMVLDVRFGRMWGETPQRYQPTVGPNDIALRDSVRFTRVRAAERDYLNPNHRYQFNATANVFRDRLAGTHDFKFGVQVSRERMAFEIFRNGDIMLETRDGVPFQAFLSNTPLVSDHRLNTWGLFVQDQWRAGRLTINAGVRIDGVNGFVPAQSNPAGTYVEARNFEEIKDVLDFAGNAAGRLGVTYDVFGTGRTAVKGYYGRFYNQFGSEIIERVNPNAFVERQVSWNDLNGNLLADPGELGAFFGFPRGLFPRTDPDMVRPYSEEYNVGVEHSLGRSFAIGVAYHARTHRDGLGIVDLARPASAYTPEVRTFTNGNVADSVTIYRLRPEFAALNDRVITNVDVLRSNYHGAQIDFQKKMSDRWQLLAGLSVQKHRGFEHSGTFTNFDFNNPNVSINRDDAAIFTDLPWTFNLSGSYQLPWQDIMLAGKYTARAGDPLLRQISFGGLTASQVSENIRVQPRGVDRTEDVTKFIDLRISKRFRLARAAFEGTVDIFNLANANHVLLQNETLGSTWGRPSRILTPRIVRLGVTARF